MAADVAGEVAVDGKVEPLEDVADQAGHRGPHRRLWSSSEGGPVGSQGRSIRVLLQLTDAHAAQDERAGMIALDTDVASPGEPVVRVCRELARRYFRFPVRAPQLVGHDFLAVQPVLDVRIIDDDARRVPLVEWPDDTGGWRVEGVRRGGGAEPIAAIGRVGVVEELKLRCAPEDIVVFTRAR